MIEFFVFYLVGAVISMVIIFISNKTEDDICYIFGLGEALMFSVFSWISVVVMSCFILRRTKVFKKLDKMFKG